MFPTNRTKNYPNYHGRRRRRREQKENSLDAQIPGGENIHPLQRKARKHLDGPPAQSPHGRKLLQHLGVAGLDEHLGAELAACELFC